MDQLLADYIDFAELQQRHQLPTGPSVAGHTRPIDLLRCWTEAARGTGSDLFGERVAQAYRVAVPVLICGGVGSGWLFSAAVFAYDGSTPVNVALVLAALVVAPLLLVIPTLFAMAPGTLLGRIPLLGGLHRALLHYSPGVVLLPLLRRCPQALQEHAELFLGASLRGRALYGPLLRKLVLYLGQIFATTFYAAACAGALYRVVFSDLAFSWSTTLTIGTDQMLQLTDTLSLPWSRVLPQAVPTRELVEASRYYRFDGGSLPSALGDHSHAALLTGWWSFLLAAIGCYALLPRIVLLFVTRRSARTAVERALVTLPGAHETLAVLRGERALLGAPSDLPLASDGSAPALALSTVPLNSCIVAAWALTDSAALQALLASRGLKPLTLHQIGGPEYDGERQFLHELRKIPDDASCLVLTKQWEPPTGDLLDFLAEAVATLPRGRALYVAPIAATHLTRQALRPTDTAQKMAVWQRTLAKTDNAALRLIDLNTVGER
ncbi:MAG: DUF2868 domain-containing protein [Bdellovibrionales bacterium]|nr:DUF2868 domain-containing protein [Bdellovibrionales bacterium]